MKIKLPYAYFAYALRSMVVILGQELSTRGLLLSILSQPSTLGLLLSILGQPSTLGLLLSILGQQLSTLGLLLSILGQQLSSLGLLLSILGQQSINQSEPDLYSATYTTRCPMALNMKLQDTTKYKITQIQV